MTPTTTSDHGSAYDNSAYGEGRVGNWMQTYSGRQFWPLDPRPDEIYLEDIAHALSNACRFAGHSERFYSVAEHSLYVAKMVPPELRLTALLHDATEAYVVDVPRPLKPFLEGYSAIENKVWEAIAQRFNLPVAMPPAIKEADTAVLMAEAAQIMKAPPAPWCIDIAPAPVIIQCLSPSAAKRAYTQALFDAVA